MNEVREERRHEPRIRKLNLVQVSRFDEEGFRADLATGRTLDISHSGLRLELSHPLPLVLEPRIDLDAGVSLAVRGQVLGQLLVDGIETPIAYRAQAPRHDICPAPLALYCGHHGLPLLPDSAYSPLLRAHSLSPSWT